MKIFIFGAGASLASQGEPNNFPEHQRAPLANQLFESCYQSYAENLGFSTSEFDELRLTQKPDNSVEQYLTNRWKALGQTAPKISTNSEKTVFGKITYYLWWMLQNISRTYDDRNLYRLFLRKLVAKRETFGIINFNYDTLLDRAYQKECGCDFDSVQSYINWHYIKPHGSVNWLLQPRSNDPAMPAWERNRDIYVRYNRASSMIYSSPISIGQPIVLQPSHSDLNEPNIVTFSVFGGQHFYPLMLLPLTSKLYPHFEGFKEVIISAAQNMISEATEIYLIGYRAVDEVIQEIFGTVKPNTLLHVVNLGDDTRRIRNDVLAWRPELKSTKGWDTGFADFIKSYFKT